LFPSPGRKTGRAGSGSESKDKTVLLMARYRISLFFISAALLALEISLMRVLKVEGWGNFTYTAIALALLGFGASGTLFSIWGRKAASREYSVSLLLSAGFILFLGLGSYLSPFVIFDPLRVVWDLSQLYRLLLRYLFSVSSSYRHGRSSLFH